MHLLKTLHLRSLVGPQVSSQPVLSTSRQTPSTSLSASNLILPTACKLTKKAGFLFLLSAFSP